MEEMQLMKLIASRLDKDLMMMMTTMREQELK